MRRPLAPLALLMFLLPLGGCLDASEGIEMDAKGAGTITSRYVVDLAKYREFLAMGAMFMGRPTDDILALKDADLPDPVSPATLRAKAKDVEGYEIREAESTIAEGRRTTTATATFTSLEAAARGGAFYITKVVLSRVDPGEETPNGAWKLAFEDPMSQADPSLFGGMDPKGMLASLQPYLGGLAVRRSITLPTRILATNGETSENGRTVSWSLSFAQLMEGKSLGMWVTFEPAEGMALQPFRVGPDLADLMRQAARQMKAGGMAPPGSGDSEGESGDPDEAPPEDTEPEDAPDAPGGQEPDAPGGQEPDAPGGQEPKDAPPGEGR